MTWKDYYVTIDVTDRHTIPVRAQSKEEAEDRAERIFEEGVTPYDIQAQYDVEVRSILEVKDESN